MTTTTAKKKPVTKSARAQITFPVARIQRQLRTAGSTNGAKVRVQTAAAVYLASVLEYLTAEVLELSGNMAKDTGKKRIAPRHITLAVRGDEELDRLVGATIAGGGVVPHIHKGLLAKGKKAKKH